MTVKEPKKEGKKEDENLLCSAKTSSFFLRKDLLHMVDGPVQALWLIPKGGDRKFSTFIFDVVHILKMNKC